MISHPYDAPHRHLFLLRRSPIVDYVAWFNTERLHSALGDLPPIEYARLETAR